MKEDSPKARPELPLRINKEVSRIAGSLAQSSIGFGAPPRRDDPSSSVNGPDVPLERVKWLIRIHRSRSRYFPPQLFADPAWAILLDLLRAELAYERLSISNACIAAGVPPTTGLRWLKALEQQGLVLRRGDPLDARRAFVVLSTDASKALRRYFLEVVGIPHSDGS